MTGQELVNILKKRGWQHKNTRGSHYQMVNPETGQKVPIPVHGNRDIPTKTLHAILRQIGLKRGDI